MIEEENFKILEKKIKFIFEKNQYNCNIKLVSKEGEIVVSADYPEVKEIVLRMVQKSEKNEKFCEDLINNVNIKKNYFKKLIR